MMWGYYDGWSWLWMTGLAVLFWGVIIALGVWAFRSLVPGHHASDTALETLRQRFAAGEISQEEFEKTRSALQS